MSAYHVCSLAPLTIIKNNNQRREPVPASVSGGEDHAAMGAAAAGSWQLGGDGCKIPIWAADVVGFDDATGEGASGTK